MSYCYSEIKDLLDASSSFIAGSFPHSYVCFDVTRVCNIAIKELLEESGYWLFAPYRSKKLVYYHQIMAFLFVSKKKKFDGQKLVCHHINGNTRNNHPSNLVYLTEDDHVLVTKFQRRMSTVKFKIFGKYKGEMTSINLRGTKVVNWIKFIMGVIAKTIKATFEFTGVKYNSNLTCGVLSTLKWAFKVVTNLVNIKELNA